MRDRMYCAIIQCFNEFSNKVNQQVNNNSDYGIYFILGFYSIGLLFIILICSFGNPRNNNIKY